MNLPLRGHRCGDVASSKGLDVRRYYPHIPNVVQYIECDKKNRRELQDRLVKTKHTLYVNVSPK